MFRNRVSSEISACGAGDGFESTLAVMYCWCTLVGPVTPSCLRGPVCKLQEVEGDRKWRHGNNSLEDQVKSGL